MVDIADPDVANIQAVVQDYFRGIYDADVDRLNRIFNPQCWLFGQNANGNHEFPVEGFIDQIAGSPAPRVEGEPFEMTLVALDRTGPVAMAKAQVLYQGRHYTDYLMLHKTEVGWRIVSKAFFCAD